MTQQELRLELLRLTKPVNLDHPDVELWIGRAKAMEAWIGEAAATPAKPKSSTVAPSAKPVDRTAKAVYSD